MGQEFHVVRCYACASFQTHHVRKDKKFTCKLCGEKQSVRKEYGRGTGRDCRVHVQKLNTIRRGLEEGREAELEARLLEECEGLEGHLQEGCEEGAAEEGHSEGGGGGGGGGGSGGARVSKWAKYLSSDSEEEEEEEDHTRLSNAVAAKVSSRFY